MSYQVLARKWRPRTFREMVGQEHVLQALINALDHDRLHHAYLFTGTRGVGKTTIARILAKCLNCEVGVSSVPCNECSSCIEINEGRFVDLIEVDAASRTKVEDTRELLENVQYAPTRGRYKVYLIDEVHMLSNSSFNALLKTLEEPPPHVKFLLATTDPQKLPVTILSRCLQFNLKNMNPERIVSHLQFVLEKEMVPFEDSGLWQLARSADGSMRDALSLTDQSIAFGDGKITDADVCVMLGTIDQSLVYNVLQALITEDVKALLNAVASLAEHSPDYSAALAEIIATLHRIAIAQALPEAVDNSQGDRQQIYDFAQSISAEDIQLYYQTALLGRRDLPLVPDPRSGFEMVLLRMLAFKPQGVAQLPTKTLSTPVVANEPEQPTAAEAIAAPDEAIDVTTDITADITTEPPTSALDSVSHEPVITDSVDNTVGSVDGDLPSVDHTTNADAYEEYHSPEVSDQISSSDLTKHSNAINSNDMHRGEPETTKKSDMANAPLVDFLGSETQPEAQPEVQPESEPEPELQAHTAPEQITQEPLVQEQSAQEQPAELPSLHERLQAAALSDDSELNTAKVANAEACSHVSEQESVATNISTNEPMIPLDQLSFDNWFSVYSAIETGGLLQSTVANCQFVRREQSQLFFILDQQQSTLYDSSHQQRLAELLSHYFSTVVTVEISLGEISGDTPSLITLRRQQERLLLAKETIEGDPVVQQLQEIFGATIIDGSITPID